jgi:TolB protein
MTYTRLLTAAAVLAGTGLLLVAQTPPPQQTTPPPQQTGDVTLKITGGGPGLPPRLAVPDFIPLSSEAETVAAAKTMGQVLWDDLAFEREFYLIPRDTYRTIPQAASMEQVPLDRWKELGADGLVVGTVRRTPAGLVVQMRLLQVMTGQSAMGREYSGKVESVRFFAHTMSDEIHLTQRALRGVARTKLAFTSDRDGERMKGPVDDRGISNIYVSDYDGANQTRVTIARALEITPTWAPGSRMLAFTSYRSGYPDVLVMEFGKALTRPARGTDRVHNYLPAWSPDGSKIAFMSSRDGNNEIYVVNRDGSGMRRLTNHPAIDVTPTWSPTGGQIAFTSDRSGTPQVWVMNADGSGLQQITRESWCDRPTWSPAPFNEIAYASRSGGGYDIRIFDFATRSVRQITEGIGSNESPAFSPTGRHLAFTSTRAGKEQIFTIARDGKDLRQITRTGMNRYPDWSPLEREKR